MQVQSIKWILLLLPVLAVVAQCGKENASGPDIVVVDTIEEIGSPVNIPERDAEKKLSEYKIPIYKNAHFERVLKNRAGEYLFCYILPEKDKKSTEKVNIFYDAVFDELNNLKEWKRIKSGNLIMHKTDDDISVAVSNVFSMKVKKHYLIIRMRF